MGNMTTVGEKQSRITCWWSWANDQGPRSLENLPEAKEIKLKKLDGEMDMCSRKGIPEKTMNE